MNRRKFVVQLGSVLIVLPASRVLVGCAAGEEYGNVDAGTDAGNSQALTFTSSVSNGHTHTVQIQSSELTSPPAGGFTRDTSITSGHLHTVELTEADLSSIEAGNTVTKTTSLVGGHTHMFTFTK
ncbi:MAG: hypothetical protein WBV82_21150 [Myxococcaceae bacterium]